MKIIYIVELAIAVLLFFIILILAINKKRRKIKLSFIIFLLILDLLMLVHVGYSYFSEEPSLNIIGLSEFTMQANEQYKEQGIQANYHEKDISNQIKIIGSVNTSKPGTYVITYKYEYGKDKIKEAKRVIIVEDKEAPILKLRGQREMTIYTDETYKEPGYTAQDNVDHNLDKQVKIEKKQINGSKYELKYTVTDSSGNTSTITRTINLKKRKPITNQNTGTSTGNSNGNKEIPSNKVTSGSQITVDKGTSGQNSSGANTGIIYLTFDDGPSLDITPKMLDILKEENVPATFFILNYSANKEYLIKREANEGHSIGIHGYSHDYRKIYQSVDTYMQNVTKLQSKIKKSTGITTTITRFPGGSSNTVSSFNSKIMTKLTKEVVNRGFKYYDWNVSSGDASTNKSTDRVYRNVTKNLVRNRSNVVLMHDFSGNNKTLNALRAIIQYGKSQGYTFRAITKDTPMVTHGVNN